MDAFSSGKKVLESNSSQCSTFYLRKKRSTWTKRRTRSRLNSLPAWSVIKCTISTNKNVCFKKIKTLKSQLASCFLWLSKTEWIHGSEPIWDKIEGTWNESCYGMGLSYFFNGNGIIHKWIMVNYWMLKWNYETRNLLLLHLRFCRGFFLLWKCICVRGRGSRGFVRSCLCVCMRLLSFQQLQTQLLEHGKVSLLSRTHTPTSPSPTTPRIRASNNSRSSKAGVLHVLARQAEQNKFVVPMQKK